MVCPQNLNKPRVKHNILQKVREGDLSSFNMTIFAYKTQVGDTPLLTSCKDQQRAIEPPTETLQNAHCIILNRPLAVGMAVDDDTTIIISGCVSEVPCVQDGHM